MKWLTLLEVIQSVHNVKVNLSNKHNEQVQKMLDKAKASASES